MSNGISNSDMSTAAGLKNGQSDQKRNFLNVVSHESISIDFWKRISIHS